jgi:hypothetical protein
MKQEDTCCVAGDSAVTFGEYRLIPPALLAPLVRAAHPPPISTHTAGDLHIHPTQQLTLSFPFMPTQSALPESWCAAGAAIMDRQQVK